MPTYTTISAGSTATIGLAAGSTLKLSGMGTAQLVPPGVPGTDSAQRTVSGELSFGPYPIACSVSAVAGANTNGLRYYVMAAGDAVPPGAGQAGAGPLSADSLQALVSDAGKGSSYYRAFLPGLQPLGSGAVIDYSGHGADGAIASTTALSDAECWAARDGFTTVAATATPPKVVAVPAAKAQIDGVTESIIFSMRIKKAAPAATETLVGFSAGGVSAANRGWRIPIGTDGKVLPRLTDGTNQFNGASSTLVVAAASAEWHTYAFAFDCITKQFFQWVDGVLSDGPLATGLTGTLIPTSNFDLWFGGNSQTNNTSLACVFAGIHLIAYPGALPANITAMMRKLHTNPFVPLNAVDLGA